MKQRLSALIIDDEPAISSFIAEVLRSDGWKTDEAESAEEAFEKLSAEHPQLIFCDVMLGASNGYEVLRRFSETPSEARFIMMTGQGSAVGALDATAIGADDYLIKPFSVDDILNFSGIVREQFQSRGEKTAVSAASDSGYVSDITLIGKSPKFIECLKLVGRVAATNLPVLITGESGTGKEIVAQSVHQRSRRAAKPFIAVNCGAMTETLIESELFGHARGAFTGADRERVGLWEEADGGTIFLDEITETSLLFQVKLLRTLQQSEIRRVGSNRTIKVDVRVIAASNRDIEQEVESGRFRQDLMYRLNAVTIKLPSLRERIEDIPLLANYFAQKMDLSNVASFAFSNETLKLLENHDWKGNVRELENAVLHAATLAGGAIYPEHLPLHIQNQGQKAVPESVFEQANAAKHWISLAEMQTKYAVQVLEHTGGNKQKAARMLEIDRKTLTRILNRADSK